MRGQADVMAHHLVSEVHQRFSCHYCLASLDKSSWHSLFDNTLHYKQTTCPGCSRTIHMRVNFHGSGHDWWDNQNMFRRATGYSREQKPGIAAKSSGLEAKAKLS